MHLQKRPISLDRTIRVRCRSWLCCVISRAPMEISVFMLTWLLPFEMQFMTSDPVGSSSTWFFCKLNWTCVTWMNKIQRASNSIPTLGLAVSCQLIMVIMMAGMRLNQKENAGWVILTSQTDMLTFSKLIRNTRSLCESTDERRHTTLHSGNFKSFFRWKLPEEVLGRSWAACNDTHTHPHTDIHIYSPLLAYSTRQTNRIYLWPQ